jgi:hypothetical protein
MGPGSCNPCRMELAIAFALGLRHASDPDHLVAVTSLIAAEDGDTRTATRLGAWWGAGHAAVLLAIGLPLIAFKSELPAWLEQGAERAVGIVIVLLAARVIFQWVRGGEGKRHRGLPLRSPAQALGIGMLHGLAGTGAVVLLLIAAVPGQLEAAVALAAFAPASILSMALFTTVFAWLVTRPAVEPVYRAVLIPALGVFSLAFGVWYAGLG